MQRNLGERFWPCAFANSFTALISKRLIDPEQLHVSSPAITLVIERVFPISTEVLGMALLWREDDGSGEGSNATDNKIVALFKIYRVRDIVYRKLA